MNQRDIDANVDLREAAKLTAARALHALQMVERGAAPPRALQRQFTPEALHAYRQHQRPAITRIDRIRMEIVTDRLAHVAAVVQTADGRADALIMELRRDGVALPWQTTQLTTAAERELVEYTDEDIADRRLRRLPNDLDSALEAARRERDHALEQIQAHEHERRNGGSAERRRDAAQFQHRWKQRLRDVDEEIRGLQETQQARQVRQAVLDGDPIVSARIRQLEPHLGPVPNGQDARRSWRHAATALQDYADTWTEGKIGKNLDEPADDPRQDVDRRQARHAVDNHRRQHIDRTPEHASAAAERHVGAAEWDLAGG